MNVPLMTATFIAIAFGLTGIGIMIFFSIKRKKMVHCVMYCPIGTIVNITKHINPFRMYIDQSCTLCMHCTKFCKYDALNPADIKNGKPSITCTLCGDCLAGCHQTSIKYKFFSLNSNRSRFLYLLLTISLHASCIALARI
ncbi:MAG: hypothetical protein IPN68_05920 [Bacteroidetes bacterium]|nr:hypothetical protein [Bacteroidota bacterium]